jgi:hypothetical protein
MFAPRPAILLAALLPLAACGGGIHKRWTFEQAFPDPNELITTQDPFAAHKKLSDTELPRTREHGDRLLELLRARPEITAAHLVLLTRAIGHESHSICHTDKGSFGWGKRGAGEGAATIEILLNEGLPKIRTIDRRWYGELLGSTQTDPTLLRYLDKYHAQMDDGSDTALLEILQSMPGSPATTPLILALRERGQADDKRCWYAYSYLSFDDDRIALLRALLDRGVAVDNQKLLQAMRAFSFDSGREQAFALLVQKAPALQFEDAKAVVAMFSFDEGKQRACASLAKATTIRVGEGELAELVRLFSFDGDRNRCVLALAAHLHGPSTLTDARAILTAFSFDDDRLAAVKVLAPRWQQLAKEDQKALLATFSFDSSRGRASALLLQ